jgi:DNA mismatch endonuclease (patch repair protein)
MDTLTRERRSWNMAQIQDQDTKPELVVRSILHRLNARFRLHRKDLPGRPDIVLPRHRLTVLVHGCFSHRHRGCKYAYSPKSNADAWAKKFRQNASRDRRIKQELQKCGWKVVVVWECKTRHYDALVANLTGLIGRTPNQFSKQTS